MTSEEKAEIEKALEEFGQEPGVQEVAAVLRNREVLPEPLREDLELAAGLKQIEPDQSMDEIEETQIHDREFE